MLLAAAAASALGLALSVANVYFRDTPQFVGIGLQVWFYLTPVIYPLDYVARRRAAIVAVGARPAAGRTCSRSTR